MAALKYVGGRPMHDPDVVSEAYITSLLSANLSQGTVDSLISSGLSVYAPASYADEQDIPNATQAYVDAGDATRLHRLQINAGNGVVGLGASGKIAASQIDVASTQRWPKPFVSPTAYNAATVSTTSEATLYTCVVPDPGFTYRPLVTGLVDAKTAVDGQFPQVFVRNGSTSGEIVAFGYGSAESYQAQLPGGIQSQASFSNSTQNITETWTALTGWVELNDGNYTTTMSGDYIQIPLAQTAATFSASASFSGASENGMGNAYTAIRIYRSDGTVIATSGSSTAHSGTLTASATTSIPVGKLYTVQGQQTLDFFRTLGGTWNSGTLTIAGPTIANQAEVTILPSPFSAMSTTTGATTLYVRLRSSNSAASVTASTLQPRLFVCPVPA